MKRLILGLVLLGFSAPALAQINVVPSVGLITATLTKNTYNAVSIGLVPAASATDIFCISGSGTKTIKVAGLTVYGVAGTLTSVPAVVLRRASLDTGGTAATTIASPALTIGKADTANPASTATLIAYTANPTINDTSPTYIRAGYITTPTVAAGTSSTNTAFTFGANLPQFTQQLTLRGLTDQVCLNLQATTITAGVLNITVTWTEE